MNIYLIGMMGSGKSTVGKILAKKMAIPFIDLDHYIEEKNNKATLFVAQSCQGSSKI